MLTVVYLLSHYIQIKELEAQLLVERKIARQHVDNKIAQDHLHQQQQGMKPENSPYPTRSPMAERNLNSTAEKPATLLKDLGIARQMFSDSNTDTYSINHLMSMSSEKENNPAGGAQPTKARRVSLCGGAHQQPAAPTRRGSLIPLPRRNSLMLPLPLPKPATPAAAASPLDMITEQCSSPPVIAPNDNRCGGGRNKRIINSILRRSLQKKVIIRPPLMAAHQSGRRAGAGVAGTTTHGGSGVVMRARRVPVSGGRGGGGGVQHNREKERGWNNGTSLRQLN